MSRVFARVDGPHGPRTIITNDMTAAHASEVAYALASLGVECAVNDEVVAASYHELMKRRRLKVVKAQKAKPVNVIPIRKPK